MNNKLNEKQQEAVNSISGNILVIAGAGTGKTRVLICRIVNLIKHGINPYNIFAFTFTNKAANEMKERLKEIIDVKNLVVSTFHSFCYSLLAGFYQYIDYKERFTIIDDEDKLKIIRKLIQDNNLDIVDVDAVEAIAAVKNFNKYNFRDLKQSYTINYIFHLYQKILKQSCKMDLDDLLYQFYNLVKNERFILEHLQDICEHILVDECQDINNIQYEILQLLSKQHQNLFLVGDQDQCIYTFRGSNIENINHFIEIKNAKVIKLEENYRSNKNILEVANNLIRSNVKRLDKNLFTNNIQNNFKVIYANLDTSYDEAIYVSKLIQKLTSTNYLYSDICILYRSNFISSSFEKEFIKSKIPYQVFGSYPFFKHKEIKTLIYYYQFLNNNHDDIALNEIYNIPNHKIGIVAYKEIEEFSKANNVSLYEAMKQSTNPDIKTFIEVLDFLSKEYKNLKPNEFFNLFLEKLDYLNFIYKQQNAKEKINRLNDFFKMIEDLETSEEPNIITNNFINEIYFNSINITDQGVVKLMTIHQAKGLEFKIVIVVGCNEGILPSYKSNYLTIEEERRIFYVAITRAEERLYLLSANKRLVNGKIIPYKPTSFLECINQSLLFFDKLD